MSKLHLLQQQIEQDSNLPVLPPGIQYLLKALMNDKISNAQLAAELEKYPTIAVKIVAMANSAWAVPISPITSLRDSCSRVGIQLVRSIAVALSVSQVFDSTKCPYFDAKTFWISALLTAESAHLYAKNTPGVCPETARLAGLLNNMGLLWLADKRSIETSDAISISQANDSTSLSQILSQKYNLDIYAIGGSLAAAMELPEIIASTIASYPEKNNHGPLSCNHQIARQMASSVLSKAGIENTNTDGADDNPYSIQLTIKLPEIQSMADALFLC